MRHYSALFLFASVTILAQPAVESRFEVASVKLSPTGGTGFPGRSFLPGGRFTATNLQLRALIQIAYDVPAIMISGTSPLMDSPAYDIDAKAAEPQVTPAEIKRMLQSLLADRFKLELHRETKELPVYFIVAVKSGAKLQKAKDPDCPDIVDGDSLVHGTLCHFLLGGPQTGWTGRTISLHDIADALTYRVGRPVIDRTSIRGTFDIKTSGWSSETGGADGPRPSSDPSAPSLFTMLEEELGLKLESAKAPVAMLVIDRIEKPSGN